MPRFKVGTREAFSYPPVKKLLCNFFSRCGFAAAQGEEKGCAFFQTDSVGLAFTWMVEFYY
jgi:hypothetical protein